MPFLLSVSQFGELWHYVQPRQASNAIVVYRQPQERDLGASIYGASSGPASDLRGLLCGHRAFIPVLLWILHGVSLKGTVISHYGSTGEYWTTSSGVPGSSRNEGVSLAKALLSPCFPSLRHSYCCFPLPALGGRMLTVGLHRLRTHEKSHKCAGRGGTRL